jgi:hypothetical protein
MPDQIQTVWFDTEATEMKRLLLVMFIAACIGVASASSYDFQSPSDVNSINFTHWHEGGGSIGSISTSYVGNISGGNSYMSLTSCSGVEVRDYNSMTLFNPAPTTYAAATWWGSTNYGSPGSVLYDANKNPIAYSSGFTGPAGRVEVSVVGGTVTYYINGISAGSGTGSPVSQNPSYIGIGNFYSHTYDSCGSSLWDDYVSGDSEQRTVIGMPDAYGYYIKKDLTNPSANGFYNATTNALVYSATMPVTFSRSNLSGEALVNESIYLIHRSTGTAYGTMYTNTDTARQLQWDIGTDLFDTTAPYGMYTVKLGTAYGGSDIPYIGGGASVVLDADSYSTGDTATATYTIADDYWQPGTYTYRLDTISGTTGTTIDSQAVTTQNGVKTIAFQEDDTIGVYYAVLIRTSGSNDEWMNFDYAELNSYISFEGYVNDQDGNPLDGANVNISQNTVISDTTTIADGNYTASPGFYSGTSTLINVTKSGYTQYYVSLIPLVAKTVPLNFTLVDSTPTYTGLGIGGVARDGILTGSAITFGYGRPIPDATVYLVNASNGESYTKTTNNAGYYLCDEGASCFLTTKRPYDVWGEKLRFDNSPNYTAVAA